MEFQVEDDRKMIKNSEAGDNMKFGIVFEFGIKELHKLSFY